MENQDPLLVENIPPQAPSSQEPPQQMHALPQVQQTVAPSVGSDSLHWKFSPPVARNLADELGRLSPPSPSLPNLFEAEVRHAFRGGVECHEKGYGQSTQIERQGGDAPAGKSGLIAEGHLVWEPYEKNRWTSGCGVGAQQGCIVSRAKVPLEIFEDTESLLLRSLL
ncbi:hypothetical protein F443_21943 [Phytophthora nicotianae P1569]|uniref:Uncharacterized protein n=1 Tax=Phytophthora nicotianae P1569 TaxID=1317065 RepID=V9DXJ6_PHYNI|nr:hypothetical protein F443_21943 [Phytophthora nicotianae P1569]